ncbi:hypothetical protein H7K06_06825 [Priestia aryabhattai]|uniref:phage lytic cycle repressor MrpR family protein n=1 Tax=Priestia aryabhattai TaxID=412384 RepID=UPI001C8D8ACB|nr:hypothetical protein [Priestia aryabhattai]MBX9967230.1 hypothetical protein [Priestia aryabhattai]
MNEIDFTKVKKYRDLLEKTIQEINSVAILKKTFINELSSVIDLNVAKAIINGDKDILSLKAEEFNSFLDFLYKKTKDEVFNPLKYKKCEDVRSQDKKMFNASFKEDFFKEQRYSAETKRVAKILFSKTCEIEYNYNQDIFSFDASQFEEVLISLKATTIRSLQNSISTIEQYINFATKKEKISKAKGNIANRYSKKEEIAQFLDKTAEEAMIFTKVDIDALSDYAENSQDGVILNLVFDGVSHKNKFLELRNIRIQDVDKDNLVLNIAQLVDGDTGEIYPPRQVPISSHTLKMIERAMDEEKYVSITGKSMRKYKVAESDYILRGLRNNFQIKWDNIPQRIIRIADMGGYPYLNATNIAYSGQIHYVRKLMKEGLTIDEACSRIIKRFNINDNESAYYYLKARIEKANKIFE